MAKGLEEKVDEINRKVTLLQEGLDRLHLLHKPYYRVSGMTSEGIHTLRKKAVVSAIPQYLEWRSDGSLTPLPPHWPQWRPFRWKPVGEGSQVTEYMAHINEYMPTNPKRRYGWARSKLDWLDFVTDEAIFVGTCDAGIINLRVADDEYVASTLQVLLEFKKTSKWSTGSKMQSEAELLLAKLKSNHDVLLCRTDLFMFWRFLWIQNGTLMIHHCSSEKARLLLYNVQLRPWRDVLELADFKVIIK